MSKYSPVVPTWMATQLGKEVMGDYHLLLAHDVLDHPEESRALYADDHYTVIMDNSLIELGHPIEGQKMVEACKIVPPSCIVLPDYLGEAAKTLVASWQFSAELDAYLPNSNKMGVVQGKNFEECMGCVVGLMKIPGVNGLAVPRYLTEILGTRITITNAILDLYGKRLDYLHLLGFSDDIVDDVGASRIPGVDGIDSAVPARLGMQKRHLSMDNYIDPGPRGTFWEDEADFSKEPGEEEVLQRYFIHQNFARIRRWIDITPKEA